MASWRRGHKNNGGIGWLAQAWAELPDHEMREIEAMAQAGGATTAYECKVQADRLETTPTTRLRTDCATVDHAYEVLSRGETVTVAGSDMMRLRSKLAAFGVA